MIVEYSTGESATCDCITWDDDGKWFELRDSDGHILRRSEPGTIARIESENEYREDTTNDAM